MGMEWVVDAVLEEDQEGFSTPILEDWNGTEVESQAPYFEAVAYGLKLYMRKLLSSMRHYVAKSIGDYRNPSVYVVTFVI